VAPVAAEVDRWSGVCLPASPALGAAGVILRAKCDEVCRVDGRYPAAHVIGEGQYCTWSRSGAATTIWVRRRPSLTRSHIRAVGLRA
jgi:hypothetical protein